MRFRKQQPCVARIAGAKLALGDASMQHHRGKRAVVTRQQAGRELRAARGMTRGFGRQHATTQRALQLGAGNGAGAQQGGARGIAKVDDGGLEPDRGGAAVEDVADFCAQAGEHVRGSGGADVAERVRARGGERTRRQFQQAPKKRMAWHAHGDARQSGGNDVGHHGFFRQHERERARPEFFRQDQRGGIGDGDLREFGD